MILSAVAKSMVGEARLGARCGDRLCPELGAFGQVRSVLVLPRFMHFPVGL